jgi:hypothetical protein
MIASGVFYGDKFNARDPRAQGDGALQGHQRKSRFPKSLTSNISLRGKFAIKYRARSQEGGYLRAAEGKISARRCGLIFNLRLNLLIETVSIRVVRILGQPLKGQAGRRRGFLCEAGFVCG